MGERRGNRERKPAGRFRSDSRSSSGRSGSRSGGFRRDDSSGRFNNRSSGRSSGRRDDRRSGRLEMHKIICDKCGKESEVPFKPTSSKPVYCSDCFKKQEGSSGSRKSGVSAEDIAMLNMKLDKIMQALKID